MIPDWPNVDNYLLKNTQIMHDAVINKDWDCVCLVDGEEGSGKSVMAQQLGHMLSVDGVELDNIVFTPRQFKKGILNSERFSTIIWDEARGGLNSRRSMSSVNNTIVDMLAEIRQKNLFVVIVMPTFYDMDKNVAMWRSRFLIHVFTEEMRRGYFRFYGREEKKLLYLRGRKEYSYSKSLVKPSFPGTFGNYYMVDEKAYREKKLENLRAANLDITGIKEFLETTELNALSEFREAGMLKTGALKQYAEWKGISQSALSHRLKRLKPIKHYLKSDIIEDLELDS